ncbi:hypothetical protein HFO05_33725 [Rhizobium laguerreae]|uniref:hypothetical protein n=1 Tax=Rhizobium laguerreae TaxID=1076926 RepID=UPI001C91BB7D|nr:hypothetical protein [Rhizobium laguerreae]MBY3273488.1 hypothetical protein [Rhizobium laguerreae]
MATRIGSIIAIADRKSENLLDSLPDESRAKSNIEAISGICRNLLQRRTPILPTAKLVSEEGRKHNPHFPLERTIYNSYQQPLRIWKKAYHDVMNIDADPPIQADEVAKIDTSVMVPSIGNLIDRLKEIVAEVTQRNNVLKKIIDDGVTVPANDESQSLDSDEVVRALGTWLRDTENGPFKLDGTGLRVTGKTPPGTRIMSATLFEILKKFILEYELIQKTRKAREG